MTKDINQFSDEAAAVYVNRFYVREVDGGRNVKLTFFEQCACGIDVVRASLLLSRANFEALMRVSGDVLGAGEQEAS